MIISMELSPKPEHVSQTKLLKTFAFCTPLLTLLCMLRPVAEGLKNLFNYIAVWMAEIWQNSWGLVFASQNYGCRYMEFSVYMNIYIYIYIIYIHIYQISCVFYIYIYICVLHRPQNCMLSEVPCQNSVLGSFYLVSTSWFHEIRDNTTKIQNW